MKRILSVLIVIILVITVMPAAVQAATIKVTATYYSATNTAKVTWDAYSEAKSYKVFLMAYDPASGTYKPSPDAEWKLLPADGGCEYTLDSIYFSNYDFGASNYRIDIAAYDIGGKELARGSSITFKTDLEILSKPAVTIDSMGVVTWSSVANAKWYYIAVYREDGEYIHSVGVSAAHEKKYDFSEKLTVGERYYATAQATADGFRDSEVAKTAAITFDNTPKYIVKGAVTSFLNSSGEVHLALRKRNSTLVRPVASTTVTGNNVSYKINDVPEGRYTLYVSKDDHVTRRYDVTVSADKTLNVKIHPVGDIDGDGDATTFDFALANSHAKGISTLEGYALSCADVDGEDGVTTFDAALINAHAKGVSKFW